MLGGTLINYQERPVTQKTQFGSEPVNNTIVAHLIHNITQKLSG